MDAGEETRRKRLLAEMQAAGDERGEELTRIRAVRDRSGDAGGEPVSGADYSS